MTPLLVAACGSLATDPYASRRIDPSSPYYSDSENCGEVGHICPSGRCERGDCVRRAFITSEHHIGDLGGLLGADSICQAHADAVGLGGSWQAWLSDRFASPSSRLTPSAAPYVLPDGTQIANDWNDLLDGALDAPICVDEAGMNRYGTGAWSNTNGDGTQSDDETFCAGWDTVGAMGSWRYCMLEDSAWTSGASNHAICELAYRLYCFEE